jgi:hypothetical protein
MRHTSDMCQPCNKHPLNYSGLFCSQCICICQTCLKELTGFKNWTEKANIWTRGCNGCTTVVIKIPGQNWQHISATKETHNNREHTNCCRCRYCCCHFCRLHHHTFSDVQVMTKPTLSSDIHLPERTSQWVPCFLLVLYFSNALRKM